MTMRRKNLHIAITPEEIGVRTQHQQIHNLYRIDGKLNLLRANCPSDLRTNGQLLGIASHHFAPKGDVPRLCGQILREVDRRNYQGVICQFQGTTNPTLQEVVSYLEKQLPEGDLTVSENYGSATKTAQVLLSSAISGGTLYHRMEGGVTRFGRERVLMQMDCIAEDLYIPSPTGNGTTLPYEEVDILRRKVGGTVFFSKELCARYFTYQNHETGLHFVLFDDSDTISEKIKYVEEWNLAGGLLHYSEVKGWRLF
ncbi:MAG: hypothetical protein R3Y07_06550 [Eubacteriales bacterium]